MGVIGLGAAGIRHARACLLAPIWFPIRNSRSGARFVPTLTPRPPRGRPINWVSVAGRRTGET